MNKSVIRIFDRIFVIEGRRFSYRLCGRFGPPVSACLFRNRAPLLRDGLEWPLSLCPPVSGAPFLDRGWSRGAPVSGAPCVDRGRSLGRPGLDGDLRGP